MRFRSQICLSLVMSACAATFSSTKWPVLVDKPDKNSRFSKKWRLFMDKAITTPERIMLNEMEYLYNKDSSLALRMTVCIKITVCVIMTVCVKKTVCVNMYINIKKCPDYMS